jgi:beta-lactamase superfamily II metal-dependent hydrolase
MRFLPALAMMVALMLLFGCGDQRPLPANDTNGTNLTNNTKPVTIIIGNQSNQTKEQNKTETKNDTLPEIHKELEYTYEPNATIGVYFIYVGDAALHGDAILIKKGDFVMLIDAGAAEKGGKVVDFLRSKGVTGITILVSTTGDPRRYGGINDVADNFKIQRYWWGGNTFDDSAYGAIATRMANETKGVDIISDGYNISLNGMEFKALNPPSKLFDDVNNGAIVLKIEDRNFSMLLTSDIQTGAQGRLASERAKLLNSTIMEAPYYGVGTGIAQIGVMLNYIRPKTMIISGSADESAANGGSRDPLRRLMNSSQYDIKWYENYRNGTIRIVSDGQTYAIDALGS